MNKKGIIKMLIIDIIAAIFLGISIDTFIVNANFAPGGVTGLSVIANYLFNVPIGLAILLFNIPIVLLTYKRLGKKFFIVSAITMIICSLFIDYVTILLPAYTGNEIISVLFAGLFAGIGYSILFNNDSSTGGTDFIVVAIKKAKDDLSFGTLVFILDGLIVLLSSFIFKDILSFLYIILYTIITSISMDMTTYIILKLRKSIKNNKA